MDKKIKEPNEWPMCRICENDAVKHEKYCAECLAVKAERDAEMMQDYDPRDWKYYKEQNEQ